MEDLAGIVELMERKRQLLGSIENITQEMISCSAEQLETLMIRRDKQMAELQRADKEMQELCAERGDGPAILDAALCKGDPDRLPAGLAEIYQSAQRQRAIFSRLRESELQAVLRLKQEQLEILEKIKTAGQSGAAKAARFYSLTGAQGGGSSRLGRA